VLLLFCPGLLLLRLLLFGFVLLLLLLLLLLLPKRTPCLATLLACLYIGAFTWASGFEKLAFLSHAKLEPVLLSSSTFFDALKSKGYSPKFKQHMWLSTHAQLVYADQSKSFLLTRKMHTWEARIAPCIRASFFFVFFWVPCKARIRTEEKGLSFDPANRKITPVSKSNLTSETAAFLFACPCLMNLCWYSGISRKFEHKLCATKSSLVFDGSMGQQLKRIANTLMMQILSLIASPRWKAQLCSPHLQVCYLLDLHYVCGCVCVCFCVVLCYTICVCTCVCMRTCLCIHVVICVRVGMCIEVHVSVLVDAQAAQKRTHG